MIQRICRQKKARKMKECVALRGIEAMSDYTPVFCLILPTPWARAGPENMWACTLSFYKLKQNRFELEHTFVHNVTLAVRPEAMNVPCNQAGLEGERNRPAWYLYICNICPYAQVR